MEKRRLTKADIDMVRHVEGFPIAKDEDIIALSRPPYYTACPNPFINEFIQENGTPYNEASDEYHREPFAADVSEGKMDALYNIHTYHTKVPYKAIMRYILHYTKPGDVIFDGFCGTGMAGVAAQMCGTTDPLLKSEVESQLLDFKPAWGKRYAVLSDLSPAATYIAANYNMPFDIDRFKRKSSFILKACHEKYGWMYETNHVIDGLPQKNIYGEDAKGTIIYVVWSDVFVCPSCSKEIIFYDAKGADDDARGAFSCTHCGSKLTKRDCKHAQVTVFDSAISETVQMSKMVPVLINYEYAGRRYQKTPDENDLQIIARVENMKIEYPCATDLLPNGYNTEQPIRSHGITRVHQFYTKRNLLVLTYMHHLNEDDDLNIKFWITSIDHGIGKRVKHGDWSFPMSTLNGTLYIPSLNRENNPLHFYATKAEKMAKAFAAKPDLSTSIIGCGSMTDVSNVPTSCIDYIFTDPPFGGNINYSELSYAWESWLKVKTNNSPEAIMNPVQKKGLQDYQTLMERSFIEYYRVLKPGRWMTIEFNNSKNAIWNSITEAILRAGFVIADVRTLDKKTGSFKQVTTTTAAKQDLVISAYKPREAFVHEFQEHAGDPEMAWEFVRQHLRNVPVTADGNHDGKLDIISERQDYLLFDRMVAWHIMKGIPVPMDIHTFYEGLRQRFLERDGMFFLPEQVNEYDDKRAHMELDTAQLSFIVTDEKNAIQWLNYILSQGPMTYQEIQPLYMQELHQSRQEKMPELLDMLKENFVQDEKGAWYVPDLTNAADLAKVRRKALLKEFWDSCATGKGKLKVFRMEAIRAGFDECWKTRDFKTIVSVGERLPEAVLQEDPALLMYYDNACSRV